jgi:hypothetical protein
MALEVPDKLGLGSGSFAKLGMNKLDLGHTGSFRHSSAARDSRALQPFRNVSILICAGLNWLSLLNSTTKDIPVCVGRVNSVDFRRRERSIKTRENSLIFPKHPCPVQLTMQG